VSIPHSLQPRAKLPLSVLALLTPWRYIFSETHQMFSVENHHLANEELLQSFTFQFFSSRLIFEPGEIGGIYDAFLDYAHSSFFLSHQDSSR